MHSAVDDDSNYVFCQKGKDISSSKKCHPMLTLLLLLCWNVQFTSSSISRDLVTSFDLMKFIDEENN
ncbi:UNVERIFIED_CONTAM: hypothetical protein NCL1_55847 [Trichonephila clavipes]